MTEQEIKLHCQVIQLTKDLKKARKDIKLLAESVLQLTVIVENIAKNQSINISAN